MDTRRQGLLSPIAPALPPRSAGAGSSPLLGLLVIGAIAVVELPCCCRPRPPETVWQAITAGISNGGGAQADRARGVRL